MEKLLIDLKFIDSLARSFCSVKGYRIKEAYLEFFVNVFTPVLHKIEAEPNLMEWRDVVEGLLYKKVCEFLGKPRYNALTAKLFPVLVLVSGEQFFRSHWQGAVEMVLNRIRDRYLSPADFLLVSQLLHVYFFRYPEAWATMCSKLETVNKSIHSLFHVLLPSGATGNVLTNLMIEYMIVCGLKLTRATFREAIVPLFDFQSVNMDLGLKKMLIGLTAFYEILNRLNQRRLVPEYPKGTLDYTNAAPQLKDISEEFISEYIQIDVGSMRAQFCQMLGECLVYLDENVLWNEGFYEGRQIVSQDSCTSDAIASLKIILMNIPTLMPTFTDQRLLYLLLVKYLFHEDAQIRQCTFDCLSRIITCQLSIDAEETARGWESMFCCLTSSLEAAKARSVRGRQLCFELLEKLLSVDGAPFKYLPEADLVAILQELCVKSALIMFDSRISGVHYLLKHAQKLYEKIKDNDVKLYYEDLENMNIFELSNEDFIELIKVTVAHRLLDISMMLNGQKVKAYLHSEDSTAFLQVYTNYIRFFLKFGPQSDSPVEREALKNTRRVSITSTFSNDSLNSGGTLNDSSLYTLSNTKRRIKSIDQLCQSSLNALFHDSIYVRRAVVEAFQECSPMYLEEVVKSLSPFVKIISDDLRNVKYRFSRKNKKSDQLKMDITEILSGLMRLVLPRKREAFKQSPKTIQFLLKCLLETFYFCSEIDIDGSLPRLRLNLAGMIEGWAKAVLLSDTNLDRFKYLPFKLHCEMWMTLRRWWMESANHQRKSSGSTLNSMSSMNSLTSVDVIGGIAHYPKDADGKNSAIAIIDALVILCVGLSSPPPGSRQEVISLNHIFKWADDLCAAGDHEKGKQAMEYLINSNPAISDRVLFKAFESDYNKVYETVMKDSKFISIEQKTILNDFKRKLECQ